MVASGARKSSPEVHTSKIGSTQRRLWQAGARSGRTPARRPRRGGVAISVWPCHRTYPASLLSELPESAAPRIFDAWHGEAAGATGRGLERPAALQLPSHAGALIFQGCQQQVGGGGDKHRHWGRAKVPVRVFGGRANKGSWSIGRCQGARARVCARAVVLGSRHMRRPWPASGQQPPWCMR